MPRPVARALSGAVSLILMVFVLFGLVGCGFSGSSGNDGVSGFFTPTDVGIIRYHVQQYRSCLMDFTERLYAKNPKYERDPVQRRRKIASIFGPMPTEEQVYSRMPSNEVLTAAFQEDTAEPDRVYLLSLGLWKSIKEAYGVRDGEVLLSGLQIPLARLQRLHHNISQVNWRLKTSRDKHGKLLFVTNQAGEDGYINMGYEVIMTRILTRIEDDIVMRGGLPQKYIFTLSTMFVGIII